MLEIKLQQLWFTFQVHFYTIAVRFRYFQWMTLYELGGRLAFLGGGGGKSGGGRGGRGLRDVDEFVKTTRGME